jgi:putative flippase GtrA
MTGGGSVFTVLRRLRNISVFAVVGLASTLAYALLFNVLHAHLPVPAALSSVLAYSLCAVGSYLGHRHLSFRSARAHALALPRFVLVSFAANAAAFLIAAVLTDWQGYPVIVTTAVICVVIPLGSLVLNAGYVFGANLLPPQVPPDMPVPVPRLAESRTARAIPDTLTQWGWLSVLALLCMAMLAWSGGKVLGDPDTPWHVATGKLVWESMAMPHADTWSHTFTGQPWIARDWLSQVLLYLGFLAGGWPGTALMAWLAVALSLVITGRVLMQHAPPLMVLCMGWMAFTTLHVTLLARPHIMALPVLALWTAWLVQAASTTRRPPWLALGVMVLWSNLHAGFTIGFVIAAAIALDAIWRTEPADRLRALAEWLLFGCGCILAAMLNPYGYASLVINIQMAAGNEGMAYIDEWEPMAFHGHNVMLLSYSALLLGSLLVDVRKNAFRLLLGAFVVYTCMKHERFVMLMAIVLPILAQESAPKALRLLLDRLNAFQNSLLLLPQAMWKPAAMVSAAVFAILLALKPAEPPSQKARDAVLSEVPAGIRQGKVFNSYNLGGYLVSRNVPTFIDGRTDQLFLGGFLDRFMDAILSKETDKLGEMLDQHGVSWAFVTAATKEAALLERLRGWRLLHANEQAKVFVRIPG